MRIAFVGAAGYGNVGDDSYPLVFRDHFPEHELLFFNSDLPAQWPEGISMLVMGGGGILHNVGVNPDSRESPHFRCMRNYLDAAIERRIPFGFLSCGFQFPPGSRNADMESLRVWAPYLAKARFVTLRSPSCVRIAQELAKRNDVRFFPDAAYLLRPGPRSETDSVIIVPAGAINARDPFIEHFLRLFDSIGFRQVWISMGSAGDDAAPLADARLKYPAACVVEQPTPREALEHIGRARFVLTGRYHGMVFARSCGVPFFVSQDSPHKIASEDWRADPAGAAGHIETLRNALAAW